MFKADLSGTSVDSTHGGEAGGRRWGGGEDSPVIVQVRESEATTMTVPVSWRTGPKKN